MLGQPILVCTAHIHWDPEFCDVKLIQTMMLSNELRSILDDSARTLRQTGQRDNGQLLLCGDFNSLPDSSEKGGDKLQPKHSKQHLDYEGR